MGTMYAQGSDVGEFPNSTSADNSTEFDRSGSTVTSITNNTSDTASSDALNTTRVEGTSGGDPYIKMQVGNSDSWSLGPLNSAALPDNFRITYNPDGSASPSNFTNAPITIDGIDTGTGESRVVIPHSLAVAGIGGISSAKTVLCHVLNDNEALLSHADVMLQTGDPTVGAGGGDMMVSYQAPNMAQFVHGVSKATSPAAWQLNTDNSDFSGGNVAIVAESGGEVLFPSTPAFMSTLLSSDPNVTGDGTVYVLGTTTAMTERFDQNSNFDGSTFTAPITGRYFFSYEVSYSNLSASHDNGFNVLSTSNLGYRCPARINIGVMRVGGGTGVNSTPLVGSIFCDMDAGDTANIQCFVSEGTLTVGVVGDSAASTNFGGFLQC